MLVVWYLLPSGNVMMRFSDARLCNTALTAKPITLSHIVRIAKS